MLHSLSTDLPFLHFAILTIQLAWSQRDKTVTPPLIFSPKMARVKPHNRKSLSIFMELKKTTCVLYCGFRPHSYCTECTVVRKGHRGSAYYWLTCVKCRAEPTQTMNWWRHKHNVGAMLTNIVEGIKEHNKLRVPRHFMTLRALRRNSRPLLKNEMTK